MKNKEGPKIRLKILSLEDCSMDADLISEYLRANSSYAIDMEVVSKEKEFATALRKGKYDLILADFKLIGFDGFAALNQAKALAPLTPFICVSGSIGEDTAVELLKQGAIDYVLKDKMGRLIFSIERALKAAKEQEDLSKASQSLIDSETKHKAMIANISDVIMILDENGEIAYTSPNSARWFGWEPKDLYKNRIWENIHPEDLEASERAFSKLMQSDRCEIIFECRIKCKDGSYKFIQLSAINLISNPIINGLLINYHDITERKNKEREILYLNNHDFLTGLYNRVFFEEEKKRLDTERQLPISIITGDINGLKLINDAFGYSEGDGILIKIAKVMKNSCRAEDIIARVGGDEFCILLPRTDENAAQLICSRIMKACKEFKINHGDSSYYPSIALGYATKNLVEKSIDSVFKVAEELMFKHKLLEGKSVYSAIIASMKTTMFEKSQETEEHAERLVILTKAIGKAMSFTEDQLSELELLATLHDIGKMSIDASILNKPDKLTDEEWAKMKKHPEAGFRIASTTPELAPIALYILSHHERWDGLGYPQGLTGEEIPLLSRILAIADSYDAMTNDRPYRKRMSKEEAICEIEENAGTQFDPAISKIFIEIYKGK